MDLTRYKALAAKVDAKFAEIRGRREEDFACRKGCHSCCVPDLTVFGVEKEAITRFFAENPERLELAQRIERDDPHDGERCAFLDSEGGCAIYEARPLVCRSHGAPIVADSQVDVCPLNFTETKIQSLPAEDLIQLGTLNMLLGLVNLEACPGDKTRYPLKTKSFTE